MKALTLVALCALATPALAQSKKYPPVAPDKDLQAEKRSGLWESTLHPDNGPYAELVRDGKRLIDHSTTEDVKTGLTKLEDAIKRLPKEPGAYLVRDGYYLTQRQWAECANDLAAAEASTKVDDPMLRSRTRIDLAVCQARSGKYAEAENTLIRASSNAATYKGELMMRLGETRIEQGKLDEAIDALTAAMDQTDSTNEMTRWLLAMAYDRARRPTDAQQYAIDAKHYDQSLSMLSSPRLPFLGADDKDYLSGIAYLYAAPRAEAPIPEYALLYFRQYVKNAPDSQWKRRAEEHIKEISEMKLPTRYSITSTGSASVNVDEFREVLSKPMWQMRQCVASQPGLAFQVSITKDGPTGPDSRDQPRYRMTPEGVRAQLNLDVTGKAVIADTKQATDCLEKIAARIGLPRPKEHDTYYSVSFTVVAP